MVLDAKKTRGRRTLIEQGLLDVRYGLRMLRRNPGFAAVTILTLALGIGVNTSVFSVINAVLLRSLPYPEANRIVAFSDGINASNPEHFKPGISEGDFAEWHGRAKSSEKMAGYNYADRTLATRESASQTRVISVAGDFWAITGARVALGRLFKPEESQNPIILSYSVFKRQFQGDPSIVGKTVALDGKPMTVSGVLRRDFQFLLPQDQWSGLPPVEPGAYVSAPPPLRSEQSRLFVIARLKPRVTMASALAELQGIESSSLKSYPDRWFPGVSRMELIPLQTRLAGTNRQALLILQVAGLFVLLIAIANIANLLLARGASRTHEMAVRAAVGAGAIRILRQFVVEGIVLAALGGAAGLLVARWAITTLVHFGANAIPRLPETSIDEQVLAFTFGLCLGCGVFFGFGPAFTLWKDDIQNTLREGAKSCSIGGAGMRLRRLLVACEFALAVILLTGAGLMVKSFWRMYANPPGFAPENMLLMKVSLSGPQYADKARQITYFRELLHRLESMPGVRAYGIANIADYLLQSKNPSVPAVVNSFRESLVSPGYLHAIGMRLLKGRWLSETDPPDATIINETLARHIFGNEDPIGKSIKQLGRPVRVVGVVANLKYAKLDADPVPEMFRLYSQNLGGNATMMVAVRMAGDPLGIAPALDKRIAGIDPASPIYDVQSLEQALAASVSARRFDLFLLGTFAAVALIMATVGVYGVIAYSVTERTREIGIRMALGAQRNQVLRMVVAQGMWIGLCGLTAGLFTAFGLTRLMASLLYGVTPDDPATFAAAGIALSVTALLASGIPAMKAVLIDPLTALRHE